MSRKVSKALETNIKARHVGVLTFVLPTFLVKAFILELLSVSVSVSVLIFILPLDDVMLMNQFVQLNILLICVACRWSIIDWVGRKGATANAIHKL